VILRSSRRVLSLLLSFHRSGLCPYRSISCMDRERSSGCCVILQSRFIGAASNFFPSLLCRTTAPTEHHLYLLVPASGFHLVPAFSYYHHSVVVCLASSSLALGFIVCAYYFFVFDPFRLYIFYPTLSPSLCSYSPL
jgi:hypothetical protein